MTCYRGYEIDTEEDHKGVLRAVIISPNGDSWYSDYDPESEIDQILEWKETMEETYERNEDWRRRQWELI